MKLKQISLLTLLTGALVSMIGVIAPFAALKNYTSQNGAIGIIGGADTPTYKFIILRIMSSWSFIAILLGIALIISALFCLLFSKTVKNNCSIKTTVLSLGLSAVGAAGLMCAFLWFTIVSFGEMSKHPIAYPTSKLMGILFFFAFVVLMVIYVKARKANWSIKGLIIDVLTCTLYFPTFFSAFEYLYGII